MAVSRLLLAGLLLLLHTPRALAADDVPSRAVPPHLDLPPTPGAAGADPALALLGAVAVLVQLRDLRHTLRGRRPRVRPMSLPLAQPIWPQPVRRCL